MADKKLYFLQKILVFRNREKICIYLFRGEEKVNKSPCNCLVNVAIFPKSRRLNFRILESIFKKRDRHPPPLLPFCYKSVQVLTTKCHSNYCQQTQSEESSQFLLPYNWISTFGKICKCKEQRPNNYSNMDIFVVMHPRKILLFYLEDSEQDTFCPLLKVSTIL